MRTAMVRAVGGVIAVSASVLAGVVVGPPTAGADPGCPTLNVVAVPGTWETSGNPDPNRGHGMLSGVTDGLPPGARVDYVHYSATAFPWEGEVYGASRQEAVDNARGIIAATAAGCPDTDFALVGYSQGADAAGQLAAEIGTGTSVVAPQRLTAVGLLSDPRRSETDALVGPPVAGNGAGGPRLGGFGFVSPNVRTVCVVGDLYCSTARDDFVTRMAGFLAMMSGGNPALVDTYRLEAEGIWTDVVASGGVATLQSQISPEANGVREQQLRQFYGSQVHHDYGRYVVDGNGTTATQWLHGWIASKV